RASRAGRDARARGTARHPEVTMTDNRLDTLVTALAGARPVLDDVARARVAQRIDAELAAPAPRVSRRWIPWAAGVAAAAALAVVLATRGSSGSELADGMLLVASPDTSVHAELDGSVV